MSTISAILGTSGLLISGIIFQEMVMQVSLVWWIGDFVGILLFTPFILSWRNRFNIKINREKVIEVVLYLVLLGTFITLFQVNTISPAIEKSIPFLVIPFLIWLGYRFNLQTAMTGAMITSVTAIYFTVQHQGPFQLESVTNSLVLLQVFVGVISVTLIILSSTVSERIDAQKEIKKFNENLEQKVQARTKALNEEIKTRKKAEESIIKSNTELRKTNEELDSFVYSVSHDLRAPISSVMGLINLAQKEEDLAMIKNYLEMMSKSIYQQDLFIKEILDLSRNARLELNRDKISFEEIINDIFEQLKFSADTEKINKKIDVKQSKAFYSDKRRIKVVFNNLISNAIRYNDSRKPVINVETIVDNGHAEIRVTDNGRGISEEHLDKVFKMFYRATDKGAGSGLGLYIVQETMDKLGGTVSINSQLNKGTEVLLKIPAMK
jgi:signal transduction histidine kinase